MLQVSISCLWHRQQYTKFLFVLHGLPSKLVGIGCADMLQDRLKNRYACTLVWQCTIVLQCIIAQVIPCADHLCTCRDISDNRKQHMLATFNLCLISYICVAWIGLSIAFDREPIPFAAMPPKRRRINCKEDWADLVVETALAQDWITRHETLDQYMKNRSLKHLIPERMSPCQSKYGKLTGKNGAKVIALPEYCPAPLVQTPPLKQRKISSYFLDNDQPSWVNIRGG